MYHPTTRVLAVLALLRAHGRMTGAELARRLEVDARTLRRYITMLQDLGVPVSAERGRAGAYELAPDYRMPPLAFTNDEALALAVGLLAVRSFGLAEITPAIESAQAKLEQAMPDDLKSRVRALSETVTLDLGATPSNVSSKAVMLTLSDAAQMQRRVHLHYSASRESVTERDFDPYGLAHRQGKWYVAGYCHLRRDLRSFRIDRITKAVMTEARFDKPDNFDALMHIVHAIATLPRPFSFEVLLKTDMIRAQSEIMAVMGIFEPREDGVLLRGTAEDLEWVARELARFPFGFVIHSPDALRDALRARAAELIRLADERD